MSHEDSLECLIPALSYLIIESQTTQATSRDYYYYLLYSKKGKFSESALELQWCFLTYSGAAPFVSHENHSM